MLNESKTKMEKIEVISNLEEFNKFADELFALSFVKKLKNSGVRISFKSGKGFQADWRGPDEEAIKALVNDIRRFFQKNDTLKIHKLIQVYKLCIIQDSEKNLFNKTLSELDKFNGSLTPVQIEGEDITVGKVWEVFLYGRYSHRTEGTKGIYDSWEKNLFLYAPLKYEFIRILKNYLIFLSNIVYANRQVLNKLKDD